MMNESAINVLVLCESCGHGAPFHAGDGCQQNRCPCSMTREAIVDDALERARIEMREQWTRWGAAT